MISYREIPSSELTADIFSGFRRTQNVTRCWRKIDGEWVIRDIAFTDDWTEAEYAEVLEELKKTALADGLVFGAFEEGRLMGFVSVESAPFGSANQYLDLSLIIVSLDARGRGIGTRLFNAAKAFAKSRGARKLYISAHSSVESQAFYRAMGCREALEYEAAHVEREPCDCQLECEL